MKKHRHINWDALGITTSVLCAIHCAFLPLVVAALPVLGIDIVHNPAFEYGMILLAFLIGTWALWHGFRRHHHRLTPWLLFMAGMLCLIGKQVWHEYELFILPGAVGLIVSAHILNYRLSRKDHTLHARPVQQLSPVPPADGSASSASSAQSSAAA